MQHRVVVSHRATCVPVLHVVLIHPRVPTSRNQPGPCRRAEAPHLTIVIVIMVIIRGLLPEGSQTSPTAQVDDGNQSPKSTLQWNRRAVILRTWHAALNSNNADRTKTGRKCLLRVTSCHENKKWRIMHTLRRRVTLTAAGGNSVLPTRFFASAWNVFLSGGQLSGALH